MSEEPISREMMLRVVRSRFKDHFLIEEPTAELARKMGIHPEVARTAFNGTRDPAKTFLDAAGFERVVMYRMKRGR